MINENERWYYLERANQCLLRANEAVDPQIANIHLDMHARYLEKAGDTPSRMPRLMPVR